MVARVLVARAPSGVAAILLLWRGCGNPGFGGGSGVRSGRPQRRRRTASVASTSASLSNPPSAPWTNRSDCSRSYGAGTGILLAAAALAASFLGREAFGGDPARGLAIAALASLVIAIGSGLYEGLYDTRNRLPFTDHERHH